MMINFDLVYTKRYITLACMLIFIFLFSFFVVMILLDLSTYIYNKQFQEKVLAYL
jgi:hypothetical protein